MYDNTKTRGPNVTHIYETKVKLKTNHLCYELRPFHSF